MRLLKEIQLRHELWREVTTGQQQDAWFVVFGGGGKMAHFQRISSQILILIRTVREISLTMPLLKRRNSTSVAGLVAEVIGFADKVEKDSSSNTYFTVNCTKGNVAVGRMKRGSLRLVGMF